MAAVAEASAGIFVFVAHFSQIRDAQRVLVAQTSAACRTGRSVCFSLIPAQTKNTQAEQPAEKGGKLSF